MLKFRFSTRIISTYSIILVNPHTPVAQKVSKEVVFRRFQGEGVEFFLNRSPIIGPH